MFRLEHEIIVEESPEVVWAFMANLPLSLTCHRLRRQFQWIGTVKPGPGSRYTLDLHLPYFTLRHEGLVTRWEPPHCLALAQWNPRHPHYGFARQQRFSVHPVNGLPGATILRSTIVGSRRPWYLEAPLKGIVSRSMLGHLRDLKRAIESTDRNGCAERESAKRLAEVPAVGAG